VLARDRRRCSLCGRRELELEENERLLADHYPDSVLETPDPFDPRACRTLCSTCSGSVDGARAHA
jgi:hypothetical protein